MTNLPPKRLLDDPNVAAELRQDLEAERQRPVNYNAVSGLAAFTATLGAAGVTGKAAAAKAASGSGEAVATKLGLSALTKGVATVLIVGSIGAAAYQVAQRSEARPQDAPRPATALQEAPHAPAPGKPRNSLAADPATAAEAPDEPARQVDPLQAEIAMLARIKRNLDARPAHAYRLSQQAQTRFGEGMLYQEREGLAVLALVKLGRMAEAQARGTRFLSRFPESPLSQRIQAALAARRSGSEE